MRKQNFIQEATRLQSSSLVWFEQRKGRITASHFHSVLHHKWKKTPISNIKAIMQCNQHLSTASLRWGIKHENDARTAYISETKTKHRSVNVRLSGLIVDSNTPFIACSPDGLISCSCCEEGVLEIKCPYKYRNESPTCDMALADKNYCLERNGSIITLKEGHKYYDQVQAQIAICKVAYCNFVCWSTEGIHCSRIYAEDHYLDDHMSILRKYFCTYLLPELLTHNILDNNGITENQVTQTTDVTVNNGNSLDRENEDTLATDVQSTGNDADTEDIQEVQVDSQASQVYCTCRKGEFRKEWWHLMVHNAE